MNSITIGRNDYVMHAHIIPTKELLIVPQEQQLLTSIPAVFFTNYSGQRTAPPIGHCDELPHCYKARARADDESITQGRLGPIG